MPPVDAESMDTVNDAIAAFGGMLNEVKKYFNARSLAQHAALTSAAAPLKLPNYKINTAMCFETKCPKNHLDPLDPAYDKCKCPRLHIDDVNFRGWISEALRGNTKPICCIFHLTGSCTKGDKCPYGHYPVKEARTGKYYKKIESRLIEPGTIKAPIPPVPTLTEHPLLITGMGNIW